MKDISYPVKIDDIPKFESQNKTLMINVFALENNDDIKSLYPIYTTKNKDSEYEIDLLYIEKEGNTHYVLIKDLGSLLNVNRNHSYICRNCMQTFSSNNSLTNHKKKCLDNKFCKVNMPSSDIIMILEFKKFHLKSRVPIAIYADFEAVNKQIATTENSNNVPYTNPKFKQEIISYGMYIKSDYSSLISLVNI